MTDPCGNPDLERWNERFSADGYLFGTQPNAFLAAQKHLLSPGRTALCVADGEGRNSVWLASQGLAVTAFDFSPVALAKARALGSGCGVNVDYKLSSVDEWDWEGARYDIVAAIFLQFATPAMRARLFEGLVRAVKPGGHLILQGYRPEQIGHGTGGPSQVEHLYTEPMLRQAFAPLEIVHLASHDDVIQEGPGHSGLSALIDMVARRRLREDRADPTRNRPEQTRPQ